MHDQPDFERLQQISQAVMLMPIADQQKAEILYLIGEAAMTSVKIQASASARAAMTDDLTSRLGEQLLGDKAIMGFFYEPANHYDPSGDYRRLLPQEEQPDQPPTQ